MAFVYILSCAGDTLYTGITTDLEKRMKQHKGELQGGAKFTKSHPPLRLMAVWETGSYNTARKFEFHCKKLSRAQKNLLLEQPEHWFQFLPMLEEDSFHVYHLEQDYFSTPSV